MTPPLTDREKVRRRYPGAYAYQWGRREWAIYDAYGLDISGLRSSQKAAWLFAALEIDRAND